MMMTMQTIKRCLGLLLLVAATLPTLSAQAFERPFPVSAKRAKMTPGVFPTIILNGSTRRLSPGARIFSRNNTIDMLGAISDSNIVVNYTEDSMGYVDRVWILTRAEAAQDLPTMDAEAAAKAAAAAAAAAAASTTTATPKTTTTLQ